MDLDKCPSLAEACSLAGQRSEPGQFQGGFEQWLLSEAPGPQEVKDRAQ